MTYFAFVKKELIESVRSYKLLILLSIFIFFGMFNPLAAKLMPELVNSIMPTGMTITLTNPVALDSWIQFYKNMTSLLTTVFVIVFCGTISGEISKGTLINMLAIGLPRKCIILAKFTSITAIWSACYLLCFGVTYGYTLFLLPQNALPNIWFSAFIMWLFGILLVASIMLGGVLFSGNYGSLLFTGGLVACLGLANIVPQIGKYSPLRLASDNIALLTNGEVSGFIVPITVTLVCIVGFISIAIAMFKKKQM